MQRKPVQDYAYLGNGAPDYTKTYRDFKACGTGYIKKQIHYDTANRLDDIKYYDNATLREHYEYSYNRNGSIVEEVQTVNYPDNAYIEGAINTETTITNTYDDLGRLTHVTNAFDDLIHSSKDKVLNRVIHVCTKDMQEALRKAVRFSPDVIVPAEMRGAEAMIALEAARTGHTVVTSLHANSAYGAYGRILTMCQMSGTTNPVHVLMNMIVEAFPVMVFKKRLPDGTRKMMEIVEAKDDWDGKPHVTPLFRYIVKPGGGAFERCGGISGALAKTLLENGANASAVDRFISGQARNPTYRKGR